ncbi:P-loop containing nucleoside triphosphate hydrolase protein [Boletus edulis BED1]|uniref:P-loop containing nucleoside triphosphate hydrolase protein n=1 Tax=Boletus edulis BED1 TaxID=1328754 RepID=A0AAD4GDM4_BOLED|nr:P-loop containing nucleoside triphosphate hydrolase protein [Boletus edulis BED1]
MNVVFAGECGTGKSSLINLITGRDIARTSNDTAACTTAVHSYKVSIDGCNLRLWDTPGLDEGSTTCTNSRSSEALVKSLHRLKCKRDIHLVVYCMHGNRAKTALLKHYETIRDTLPPTVPIVAVITRLERYQDRMENWWSNNAQELASFGMNFADHACITTVPNYHGLPSAFRERLIHSQRAVRDLILRNCPSQLLPVRFPATPAPNVVTRGQKDPGLRAVNMQITSHRVRATMQLRRIPTTLFA